MTTPAPQPAPAPAAPAPPTNDPITPPAAVPPAPVQAPVPPADPAVLAAAAAAAQQGAVPPTGRPVEPDNQEWRDYTKGVEAERDVLRTQMIEIRIQQIGLQPGVGVGVAITEGYKGPTDLQSIATYAATKYQHQVQIPQGTPAGDLAAAQAPAQAIAQFSAPVTPDSPAERAMAHDAKLASPDATRQDAVNSLTDKAAAIRSQMIPGQ